MKQTSFDFSHREHSESLYKVEKGRKLGVLEAKISENFAIFISLLKCLNFFVSSPILMKICWKLLDELGFYIKLVFRFFNILKIRGGARLLNLGVIFIILSNEDRNKNACRSL